MQIFFFAPDAAVALCHLFLGWHIGKANIYPKEVSLFGVSGTSPSVILRLSASPGIGSCHGSPRLSFSFSPFPSNERTSAVWYLFAEGIGYSLSLSPTTDAATLFFPDDCLDLSLMISSAGTWYSLFKRSNWYFDLLITSALAGSIFSDSISFIACILWISTTSLASSVKLRKALSIHVSQD